MVVNGTLQLQANPGNTVGGVSTAMLQEASAGALTLHNGSTVQLRSDSNVTFAGANNLGGVGTSTINFDVNQLTSAGSNNTLTFAPGGFDTFNTVINVTGGNGDTLALGPIIHGFNGTLTVNANSANVIFNGGIGIVTSGATGVTFSGDFNSAVTGAITNTTQTTGVTATPLTKNGAGTLTLTGANAYLGTTTISAGKLQLGNGGTTGTLSPSSAIVDDGTFVINRSNAISQGTDFSGAPITGSGSFIQAGRGTTTLNTSNTYSGNTTVSSGTLVLQTSNAISQTSQVILAGGTLGTSFTTQDFTTSLNPPASTLKLTANSTIDLGGISSTVKFANSNDTSVPAAAWTSGAILRVSGWNGTPVTGSASDPEQLIVGTDTAGLSSSTQLNHIHFTGYYTGAAFADIGVNPGEVVPANTATILKGDVNQDGSVSVADISALMVALTDIADYESGSLMFQGNFVRTNHAAALDAPDTVDVADIDGDGFLTNLDIQSEINLVAGILSPLVARQPTAGRWSNRRSRAGQLCAVGPGRIGFGGGPLPPSSLRSERTSKSAIIPTYWLPSRLIRTKDSNTCTSPIRNFRPPDPAGSAPFMKTQSGDWPKGPTQ